MLKKYDYDNFTKAQQLQFAKDYGVKADEKTIFTNAVQQQLAEKMDAHLKKVTKNKIESFINGLPKEDRDAAYVEKNGGIIGKYISQKHNKRISPAQAVELGNILGMGYPSDLTKWSSAQKNALVSKLKNYGFSSGGVVKKGRYLPVDGFAEIMKKAAINNGDDGWISVKRGEEILNNDQVKEQIKLANHVMAQSKMYEMQTKMLEGIINNSSSVSENNNNVIYYDSFLRVEGNITEDVLPKVESMIKQNIEAAQSSAFKDISKQFSKEFNKLGMRRRR